LTDLLSGGNIFEVGNAKDAKLNYFVLEFQQVIMSYTNAKNVYYDIFD